MSVQHAGDDPMPAGRPQGLRRNARANPLSRRTPAARESLRRLAPARWARNVGDTLLRLPLFYKILLANAVAVGIAVFVISLLGAEFLRRQPLRPAETVVFMVSAGVLLSLLVNAVLVKLALSPLRQLERTARQIKEGDLSARAEASALADRDLLRLTATINGVLESLTATQERLREIAARALGATEEERKRIARELHDDTAQRLAVLLIRLRILRGEHDPATRDRLLEEVKLEISGALEGVRRFAHGLRPPALDELGLLPAVEAYVHSWAEAVRLPVELQIDDVEGLLSPEAELAVYRIIQEALSNTARHARARRASVRIQRRGGRIAVVVQDYGQGFSVPDVLRSGRGLGIFGMEERTVYVGGEIQIESEPGRGTRVEALIPIREGAVQAGGSGRGRAGRADSPPDPCAEYGPHVSPDIDSASNGPGDARKEEL